MNIEGVAALVTGGASGLGSAVAGRLADGGARVTILDRDEMQGAKRAAAIGGRFEVVDVTDEAAIASAIGRAEAAHGAARVLVNCAGLTAAGRMVGRDGQSLPLAQFSHVISVNLLGAFAVMSQVAARMLTVPAEGEERGVIINTSSIAAFEGQIGQTAYAASNGGIASLTLPAARELAEHLIRVVAIAPGLFRTPMLEALPSRSGTEALAAQVPHPARLGDPVEFAALVDAVIANSMLNGTVLRLDGALRMGPRAMSAVIHRLSDEAC